MSYNLSLLCCQQVAQPLQSAKSNLNWTNSVKLYKYFLQTIIWKLKLSLLRKLQLYKKYNYHSVDCISVAGTSANRAGQRRAERDDNSWRQEALRRAAGRPAGDWCWRRQEGNDDDHMACWTERGGGATWRPRDRDEIVETRRADIRRWRWTTQRAAPIHARPQAMRGWIEDCVCDETWYELAKKRAEDRLYLLFMDTKRGQNGTMSCRIFAQAMRERMRLQTTSNI